MTVLCAAHPPPPYNKPASRQGSIRHGQVIAPARGAACSNMDWHKYFEYREDGRLIWKRRSETDFPSKKSARSWLARYAGRVAGTVAKGRSWQYRMVKLFRVGYYEHRIIWEMHHGPIPDGMEIDHENGHQLDNRRSNLRLATRQQNQFNTKIRRTNRSGIKGVSIHEPSGKWRSSIKVGGAAVSLGYFRDKEEAAAAYAAASKKYHGQFGRAARIPHLRPPKEIQDLRKKLKNPDQ
jgi:hypothetical protein